MTTRVRYNGIHEGRVTCVDPLNGPFFRKLNCRRLRAVVLVPSVKEGVCCGGSIRVGGSGWDARTLTLCKFFPQNTVKFLVCYLMIISTALHQEISEQNHFSILPKHSLDH